jgi:GT2 family glycosyltransferase
VRLAVILVNWRDERRTLCAAQAVRGWGALKPDLIVVDNESTEGSRKVLGEGLPPGALVTSKINRGYGGGANLGIARAVTRNADFVLLLNSQAEITEAGVVRLLARLAQHPSIGAIGPVIHERGQGQVTCLIGGKDIARNVATQIMVDPSELGRIPGYPLLEVEYVPGAALLARRLLFERVGLLDEQYFVSGEIADFGKRARDKGFRLCVDLDVHAARNATEIHEEPRDALDIYYSLRNRVLYARKHYPNERVKYLALWSKVCLIEAGRALVQKKFGKARGSLLALAHAATNRFGNQNDLFLTGPPASPGTTRQA